MPPCRRVPPAVIPCEIFTEAPRRARRARRARPLASVLFYRRGKLSSSPAPRHATPLCPATRAVSGLRRPGSGSAAGPGRAGQGRAEPVHVEGGERGGEPRAHGTSMSRGNTTRPALPFSIPPRCSARGSARLRAFDTAGLGYGLPRLQSYGAARGAKRPELWK